MGKLSLVDLAGSERQDKTGAEGEQLKEAQSINMSLSALGDVISALSTNEAFVPYRNNKLTQLMSDSLGGNAKTALIAAVSPSEADHDETLSTLRFADRMQRVETAAVVNEGRRVHSSAGKEGEETFVERSSNESSGLSVGGARGSLTPPRSDSNSSGVGLKASSPATAVLSDGCGG